ncbi:hypothetical protein [Flavobacterium sp. GCM10023249]|uniref:hypothetical protein n=1 Tax=unclassified Flavobacterium TaxID=196869 RepID=UPI0036236D88
MPKIHFIKEENGNVVIRKTASNEIITSLSPSQIVQTSLDNSNCIIIKSFLANETEKGIVINYKDIDASLCVPPIFANNRNSVLEALKKDFFFSLSGQQIIFVDHMGQIPEVGKEQTLYVTNLEKKIGYWHKHTEEYRWFEQIEYYYTRNDFPPQGVIGNLYLEIATFKLYFYFGDYYEFKSGLQNLENTIVSPTEVIRTFYFDMSFGWNNRVDLQLPFGDISGITTLKLTSNESYGSLNKQFSFESNINNNQLNYYKTKNGPVLSSDILNELGIGEATVKLDPTTAMKRITIPIIKRVEKAINSLKLEVKFENPKAFNNYIQSFMDVMSISSNYSSTTPFVPLNYETVGYLQSGQRSNKLYKQLIVDPNTGTLLQSNQNYCLIPISKKIITNVNDPINSRYIGIENEITNHLNVIDPTPNTPSKSVFSNTIIATYEKLKIISGKLFCTDNNIRIFFKYVTINSGTLTHYGSPALIAQFDLVKGWNDLLFQDTLDFDAGPATFIIIEVQSLAQSTRNVIIHGGLSCLN